MLEALKAADRERLRAALNDAHIPTLAAVLAHLTGDEAWIGDRYKPVYEPFGDPDGGVSEEAKAELKSGAAAALENLKQTGAPPPPPSRERLLRIIEFLVGEPVDAEYTDFVLAELALGGAETLRPGAGIAFDPEQAASYKVVVIGAGMSGLLAGICLKAAGIDFEIVESNADVGGTWLNNTYPGCRVDNPNHLYSYSFEPNHHWPYWFSTQDVLLDYFRGVAEKYELRPHIRFNTKVLEARYDAGAALWDIEIERENGARDRLRANAVISAVGQLNRPKPPDLPGVGSFDGPAFHSAQWDHSVELKGKRVGVIGTGASAFQFVPAIAPEVGRMTVFQRTPGWLSPTPDYHDPVPEGKKTLLETVPYYDKWYRFHLFWTMADGPLAFLQKDRDYPNQDYAPNAEAAWLRDVVEDYIRAQVPEGSALREAAVPNYVISGKRGLRDNGVWLAALQRENVALETTPIAEITPKGVRTKDGAEHEFDVLIYGTGFKASSFLDTYKIHGAEGRELHEVWDGDARAYLGVTVPGFPNFFMMYGPNTNIVVNGSIIFFSECEMHYILGLLKLQMEEGARALDVKRDVFERFNEKVDAANKDMPWGHPKVNSWYKNAKGRVAQNWPYRLIDYWTRSRAPDPAEYEKI